MEEKNRKQIRKTGRKPKNDPAVNRYSINLNAEDNAKFLALFDQSGMKVIAHFITACIFQKTVKTVKIDMDAIEYHAGLTKFFGQFRGIATNYNQIVKLLNANFSDKKASAYLFKLEKETKEMKELLQKVLILTEEFEKKYLNKE
ncbi:plasmid mobilization relaxosome protein MobC [Chryseobacterium manosquense]|uniref:Plasmid mobilization relaxosome protein MobC n=1 Tax=Chryseobacterium manosquense TaxID=2754694 RepID=A0A7H1DXA9_9FLAO|nr:conjugal transfer protein MobA [Chryseobacterium manosquense]QNS41617.1 plasmid mobilization relaxosome protein MobC [Chryseobacterium manosquense]